MWVYLSSAQRSSKEVFIVSTDLHDQLRNWIASAITHPKCNPKRQNSGLLSNSLKENNEINISR